MPQETNPAAVPQGKRPLTEHSLVLSIDVGTQSIRIMAFDREGRCVHMERELTDPYYSRKQGWAELPAGSVWRQLGGVCRKMCEHLGPRLNDVVACSLTANRDNIIALDENGTPLRDWIIWVDQRRAPEAVEEAERTWRGLDKLIYHVQRPLLKIALSRSKMNWLKYHEPETWKRAKKYLTMGGFITYKLTNNYHDSYGMMCGVLPFEIKRMDFYKLPLIYKATGSRRDQMPDKLFHPGECMGTVTEEASAHTGLPVGLPLIAAGGDKQSESLGTGAFDEDVAVISYGTQASMSMTTKRCVRDRGFTFYTFPATRRGYFMEEYVVDRGYWLVTWFCRQYAQEEEQPAFLQRMNALAALIPPGSNGLFVYPFWSPHYKVFPDARGAVFGWTDDHTPAHLYRSILEGVAYMLRYGLEFMQKKSGIRVHSLRVVGGGSRSDVAMQLTADIFNLPVMRLASKEVCGAGAAIPAALYAGFYKDEEEAASKLCRVSKVFEPNPEAVAIYDRIYKKIFLKLYGHTRSFFLELQEINKLHPFVGLPELGDKPLEDFEDVIKTAAQITGELPPSEK